MKGGALKASLLKEIRALQPIWFACAVTLWVGSQFRIFGVASFWVYGLGALALGAASIGHEHSNRTLPSLLCSPLTRRRILGTKIGVLAVMILALGAMAVAVAFGQGAGSNRTAMPVSLALVVPLLCGLLLAPWFTMLSRSALGGMVFAAAVPAVLYMTGHWLGIATYGFNVAGFARVGRVQVAFMWWGMAVVSVVAAAGVWRTFLRLEAIDDRGADVVLPTWLFGASRRSAARPVGGTRARRPYWRLLLKELHLQQMTWVVVALYGGVWLASAIARRSGDDWLAFLFPSVTWAYACLLPVLVGSLVSAEERQLGTIEWQALLPVAARHQWMLKVGVALGLTVVFAIGVPALVEALSPSLGVDFVAEGPAGPVAAIALTIGAIYVSSVNGSGLRALIFSVPTALGVVLFAVVVIAPVASFVGLAVSDLVNGPVHRTQLPAGIFVPVRRNPDDIRILLTVFVGLAAALAFAVLSFALQNHRSAERGARRIWRQAAWLTAGATVAVVLFVSVLAVLNRGRF